MIKFVTSITFEERVDFNASLGRRGEGSLCPFASGAKTTQSTLVGSHIFLVLALEFLYKVINHSVVKIFTSQMSITSS